MTLYVQYLTGNANDSTKVGTITRTNTASASTATGDFMTTPLYTDTFTAPNTTNKAVGVGIFLTSTNQSIGAVIRATLQEDAGAGFVDTACTADVTVTADNFISADYVFFTAGTPYTFTTTTANKYRWKITRSSGSGSLLRARSSTTSSSTIWSFPVDDRGATITTGDDLVVATGVTSTLTDGVSFGSGAAFSNSVSSAMWGLSALLIFPTAKTKWDTAASTTVTIKGGITLCTAATYEMGSEATPYPAGKIAKLIHDQAGTAGNWGIYSRDGYLVLNGQAPPNYIVGYVSGSGTAASPMITSGNIGDVGDEILVSTTGSYNQTEYRFIKTKNSDTSYVLASTAGGAESALANTHATWAKVANITRNVVIEPANTAAPNYIFVQPSTLTYGYFYGKHFRCNAIGNSGVGKFGLTLGYSTSQTLMSIKALDGAVFNAAAYSAIWLQSVTTDYTDFSDIIMCRSASTQPQFTTSNCANKNLIRWHAFDNNASVWGLSGGTNAIQIRDCVWHGNNTGNGTNGGHMLIASAGAQIDISGCEFQWARQGCIRNIATSMTGWRFRNCNFGDKGTNVTDVRMSTGSLMDVTFTDCTFGSATLIESTYLNMIPGSEVRFHQMDGNTNKHRWYTAYGSGWSAGSGLTETTVRTASSLGVALKPENNTTGFTYETSIVAVPSTQVGIFGYMQRNATFSSGTLKVEVFFPGSTVADASYTFPTTTGSWLPFNVSAYYSGTTTRLATVRFTAVSATAGAVAYLDDLYDAGAGNKIAGFDLWDKGKPSPIMVAADYSSIPAQVWAYSDGTVAANTMGYRQTTVAADVWNAATASYAAAGTFGAKAGAVMLAASYSAPPSAASNAAAVWGYTDAGTTPGTMGDRQATVAVDVWDANAADYLVAGTTGKRLYDALSVAKFLGLK